MKKTPAELPDDVETLKRMLLERDKRVAKLETLTQKLTERVQRFEEVLNLAVCQHKNRSQSQRCALQSGRNGQNQRIRALSLSNTAV